MRKSYIVATLIAILLIGFVYVAYVLIIPPLYSLSPEPLNRHQYITGLTLDPFPNGTITIDTQSEVKMVGGRNQTIWYRPDFNYTLSIKVSSENPVEVVVYAGADEIFKGNVSKNGHLWKLSEKLNASVPRFPGYWRVGLEVPRMHGITIQIKITNLSQTEAKNVVLDYELTGYYVKGTIMNFVLVLFGVFLIAGIILHGLSTLYKKKLEEKVRKSMEEGELAK